MIWIIEGIEKLASIMEQDKIYLLHNLKILPETKIWSCAHIDHRIGLKIGGGKLYEHMKEFAKFQLICIILASTSFTMPSV